MSEVRLVVREAGRDWSGTIHASCADQAVAALSADPVTMEELEVATERFAKRMGARGARAAPRASGKTDSERPACILWPADVGVRRAGVLCRLRSPRRDCRRRSRTFDIDHRTREEWEKERRDREEFTKRCDAEWSEPKRLGVTNSMPRDDGCSAIWSRSFCVKETADVPLGIRLFGVGCRLAELIVGLRGGADREATPPEAQRLIDQLNRDFGNLRELLQSPDSSLAEALIDPVLRRFADTLDAVATAHPPLLCNASRSQTISMNKHKIHLYAAINPIGGQERARRARPATDRTIEASAASRGWRAAPCLAPNNALLSRASGHFVVNARWIRWFPRRVVAIWTTVASRTTSVAGDPQRPNWTDGIGGTAASTSTAAPPRLMSSSRAGIW